MLIKVLDRLTPEARKYVDGILSKAGEFKVESTRGSKNRGGTYNSEETVITLSTSNTFPLALLSDSTFVLGWLQEVMLLCRLYIGGQINVAQYKSERDTLLARMETTSALLEGRSRPDLSHLQQEKAVDVDSPAPAKKKNPVSEIKDVVDLDQNPYAGGSENQAKSGAFQYGPYDTLRQALDEIPPHEGMFIWQLNDEIRKAAEPSAAGDEWVIL